MNKLTINRLLYMGYCLIERNSKKHADFLRKRGMFKGIGENCRYQPFLIPSDAAHITFHNNVGVGTGVVMTCHDAVNKMLNNMVDENGQKYPRLKIGAQEIEIFDNVQIGAQAIICPGVKIGPNAVISAGAVVTKDVPPDSVVAGNPAQVVGSFSVMERMRRSMLDIEHTEDSPAENSNDQSEELLLQTEKQIIKLLSDNIDGIDFANEKAILDDSLLDSLGLISIVTLLEEYFNCKIPFRYIGAKYFNNTRAMAEMLARIDSSKLQSEAAEVKKPLTLETSPLELNKADTQKTIVQRIFEHAAEFPDDIAIIANGKETTYHEFATMIMSVSSWLKDTGIRQGDRVVVQAVHTDTCISCYYAIHLLGAILVPVEKTASQARILEIAHETEARRIISTQKHDSDIEWTDYAKIAEIDHCTVFDPDMPVLYPDLDLPCEMVFTTGTTGKSKGVLLAHKNMTWYANSVAQCVEMKKGNRFLLTTPLNHAGGMRRTHLMLANGCCIVYLDGMSNLGEYFECIEKYQVTSLYLPPAAIRILLSRTGQELSRFKDQIDFVYTSSSPLPMGDARKLCELLPKTRLYNAYEASETPGVSAYNYNQEDFCESCLGRANDGVELAILPEEGEITSQPEVQGQICVKSKMNMAEYFMEADLTQSVKKGDWFVSSDLGWLDQQGRLHLSGRKGDVINLGGYKIAPTDVEEIALLSGMVNECICIQETDEFAVPYLKLLVVVDSKANFDAKELLAFLSARMEAYKLPRKIEKVDGIKKTFNGKLDRKAYRKN